MHKKKIAFVHRYTCTGNTHAFLSSKSSALIFKNFEIVYHPSLSLEDESVLRAVKSLDILVMEGSVKKKDEELINLIEKSKYVIALGSCACFGSINARNDISMGGLIFRFEEKGLLLDESFRTKNGNKVINLSGCPANPEWFISVLMDIYNDVLIELDEFNRPIKFYKSLSHWGCTKNEFFEWKVETKTLGPSKGCLFYNFGCKGPLAHSSCNITLWNEVSSKTRAGTPCFGCTEFNFPKDNLFETITFAGVPKDLPLDVSKRIYITISGIAKMSAPKRLKEDED